MSEQPSDTKTTKTFTIRIQVGYRIQVPEPVRVVLDLKEDDIVTVTLKKEKQEPESKGATI